MANFASGRLANIFGSGGKKERRPAGVSRRRKKQLGFETLEDRRVMADGSGGTFDPLAGLEFGSISSDTLQGYIDTVTRELYWNELMAQNSGAGSTSAAPLSIPSDPYLALQWHLINTGQEVGGPDSQDMFGVPGEDINAAEAWLRGYTGLGVVVAVLDDGVQRNHPDLAANISTTIPGMYGQGNNGSPVPFAGDFHGTAVAGIIAAVANNGIGGTGVAPGATIVPLAILGGNYNGTDYAEAFRYRIQDIDITNNSWGRSTNRDLQPMTTAELTALRDSIVFGRGGLGVIHVFASGNSAGDGGREGFPNNGNYDSSSYDGFQNSRYTITVGGVDHDGAYYNDDGTVTTYPEAGPGVLVAAPTGSYFINIGDDTGLGSGIFTTDMNGPDGTGREGYNLPADPDFGEINDRDFFPDGAYTSRFNGTSAAAPMVSGVVALMLEANPNLSWRDVQEILVRSARQNSRFDDPTNGYGVETQNLWIINQQPFFQDPDFFGRGDEMPAEYDPFDMTEDPLLNQFENNFDFGMNRPYSYTNGAGYTVSQGYGVYGEQIGYGHGVVDAGLAVQMAEQWHVKGQNLAPERTYTSFVNNGGLNIPAAEKTSQKSGFQVIPGGIGGRAGFAGYWEEYFADPDNPETEEIEGPFTGQNPPQNTRGASFIEFEVPDSQAMVIETVEVKVSISGGAAAALDNMRLTLVSPDGTSSELNNYHYGIGNPAFYQTSIPGMKIINGISSDNAGNLIWTFTTNRHWGERTDSVQIMDPVTGMPLVDEDGNSMGTRGWRLHIENYGATALATTGIEVVWHGTPIQATTQRVQGFIGVDADEDGEFRYDRAEQYAADTNEDGDIRLSEAGAGFFDFTGRYELEETDDTFAENITVVATRVSDGVVVDRFVTGADGNYYFDLDPSETYTISIEDPLDRLGLDDSPDAGTLSKYQSQWTITPEWFQHHQRSVESPGDVLVDDDGVPIPFEATEGLSAAVKNINFLLQPGDEAAPEVEVSGRVFADIDGNGVLDGNDAVLPNITVYADVDRDGIQDDDEISTLTDANGNYSMVVTGITSAMMIDVRVVKPTSLWTVTKPTSGVYSQFVQPGSELPALEFALKPPADGGGDPDPGGPGPVLPGTLLGTVYNDNNGNGIRETGEAGLPNIVVYIDADNDGTLDDGEASTVTSASGAYAFTNVAAGQQRIRIITVSPNVQTFPLNNAARVVTVGSGATISNITFGVRNIADHDFGDLPALYGSAITGAFSKKGQYYLGGTVDGELSGQPSVGADGDDSIGLDDEDGVVFNQALVPGQPAQLTIVASMNVGYLQAWFDWNDNGVFEAGEQVFTNKLLNAGPNVLSINVPAGAKPQVYARFRYGGFGLSATTQSATLEGEIEDYRFEVAVPSTVAGNGLSTDANQDGWVDGADFLTWQRNVGMNSGATYANGDSNYDGLVNGADLNELRQDFGVSVVGGGTAAAVVEDGEAASSFLAAALTEGPSSEFGSWFIEAPQAVQVLSPTATSVEAADVRAELFSRRGFVSLPERLASVADKLRERADGASDRLGNAADRVQRVADRIAERLENFDPDLRRRDRAFEDFLGSLRGRLDGGGESSDGADEADAAFAAVANHFEWRLG